MMNNDNGPVVGKFFDMSGYDAMAQVQSASDSDVRLFVLTNNSSHVLVAEVHAMNEPTEACQEPGKLVTSFPYGDGEEGWRDAYKAGMAEAVRLALR